MVLLGAAFILQQERCPPVSHTPRISASCARNRQSPPRCSAPPRLRGFRLRSAEPRLRRRNTTREGVKKIGVRLGNWLTPEQSERLWNAPDSQLLKGKRDRALLSILLACGLRRREVVSLESRHVQQREDHWAIVDLNGKAGHTRTVPMPDWVKALLDEWLQAANINGGKLFRRVNKNGKAWGAGLTEKAVWHAVRKYARTAGIERLAPHDLRRTCARLCHSAGGELEQIQFLLGHVSIQTTERYLGCKQRVRDAVNDRIGIEPKS